MAGFGLKRIRISQYTETARAGDCPRRSASDSSLKKTDHAVLRFCGFVCCQARWHGCASRVSLTKSGRGNEYCISWQCLHRPPNWFKAIVGLWPWGEGSIELPDEPVFFMPPRPYLPTRNGYVLRSATHQPTMSLPRTSLRKRLN